MHSSPATSLRLLIALLALPTASATLISCENLADRPAEPMAVIDGWINSDGYPVVIFTESITPDERGSLSDKLIVWGKVTISDGTNEVVLTGGSNKDMFPPYRYYTYDMRGKPGTTYTITAEYGDLRARATCTMPEPTPIDSVIIKPIEDSDSLYAATLYFTAPDDCPAYYYLSMSDGRIRSRPLPTLMGAIMAQHPGENVAVPVFMPKLRLDSTKYIPQLIKGIKARVYLNRVTPEVYQFWKDYDNMNTFGHNQFINASTSLTSNIAGGLGIWTAQGTTSYPIEIPDTTVSISSFRNVPPLLQSPAPAIH